MKIEESIHVSFNENQNGNNALLDLEEGELLFQMDESMDPSNQVVDDIVIHTKSRDNVPTPATDVQRVQVSENEPIIEADADVPIMEGADETQG